MKTQDNNQSRLASTAAQRVDALVDRARVLLGSHLPEPVGPAQTPVVMLTVVSQVKDLALSQLRGTDPGEVKVVDLSNLAMAATDLEFELREEHERRRDRSVGAVETVFERLRHIDTPAELLARACVEVLACTEFSRVMLSRMEDEAWVPWVIHTPQSEAREVQDVRIPLTADAPEQWVSETLQASFVASTDDVPGLSPQLLDLWGAHGYAVAPIAPAGSVIGFLHADYHPARRPVDPIDRDLLGVLADDIARAYERAVFVDALHTRRSRIRDLIRDVESSMGRVATAQADLAFWSTGENGEDNPPDAGNAAAAPARKQLNGRENLTQREQEILALLVMGFSNRAIAEKLVIVEGTVKSHVKHLLRKFGAVNRSELITYALHLDTQP
jgi:DNA-binding CsgD family transcriptional regulator